MPDPPAIAHAVALLFGGLFAGTCLYTTAVAHPIRLTFGPRAALANFRASLKRSERMQPPLHAVCLVATLSLVGNDPTARNLAALVAMAPILPLSVAVIVKLNRLLETPEIEADEAVLDATLRRWGHLHRLRSTCAIVAFVALTLPF